MTEYDYSPAAYERFMESQSRVGRWVDNATDHAREFANPFLPSHSDPAEKSDFYTSSSSSHRRSKSSSVQHHSTPRSLAVPDQQRDLDHYSHRSSHREHHHRPANTRSSSSSSGTSSSTTYTARPHNSRSYTMPQHPPAHGVQAPLQPVRSRTLPHGHQYELPPMRPGQTYVIIPPHGKPVNVVSTDGSHVINQSYHTSSPTKEQPLIKRLFGLGSQSGGSSRTGSHSSRVTGAASGGKPRRSHSRRTSY